MEADVQLSVWTVPCNPKNYGGQREASDIKYLVYHYTGNDGDHDTGNAAYYRDNVVKASAHFFVDDDSATRSVPEDRVAWSVGGNKWADCEQTGGGKLHGIVTNQNSISIEMCDTSRDGKLMASEQTQENALALGRVLMELYHIPIEHVVRHFDVTGKHCPAYFMDETAWQAFKAKLLIKEGEEVEKRYNSLREISDDLSVAWAATTVEKLIEHDILKGNGLKDEKGNPADLDLSRDMLRILVWNDRAGLYNL